MYLTKNITSNNQFGEHLRTTFVFQSYDILRMSLLLDKAHKNLTILIKLKIDSVLEIDTDVHGKERITFKLLRSNY